MRSLEDDLVDLHHTLSWLVGALAAGRPGGVIIHGLRLMVMVQGMIDRARRAEQEAVRQGALPGLLED